MKRAPQTQTGDGYLDQRFNIQKGFSQFDPTNDVFNRSIWDDRINPKAFFKSYDIANFLPKKSKGFDHWDYALRNASWHLTDQVGERDFAKSGAVEGFTHPFTTNISGPEKPFAIEDEARTTIKLKQAAQLLGAGDVGIAEVDQRWVYSHTYNRKTGSRTEHALPKGFDRVIVLIMPMNYQLGKTFPSALSGATTGMGYADSLQAATMLAQFITNLGYQAMASMNDTALNIPLAIQAGLGEYGRHGLLISRRFGPNVRIAKVFTSMPLQQDHPKEFGVREFCQSCQKCAEACPPRAIAKGKPAASPPNISSLAGIEKWTVDAEKCFKFWVGMNTDCAICIRVCPYNKDYSKWWNRLGVRLAGTFLRKAMLALHNVLGFGKRKPPDQFWST